jgi:hypothetical protein
MSDVNSTIIAGRLVRESLPRRSRTPQVGGSGRLLEPSLTIRPLRGKCRETQKSRERHLQQESETFRLRPAQPTPLWTRSSSSPVK